LLELQSIIKNERGDEGIFINSMKETPINSQELFCHFSQLNGIFSFYSPKVKIVGKLIKI